MRGWAVAVACVAAWGCIYQPDHTFDDLKPGDVTGKLVGVKPGDVSLVPQALPGALARVRNSAQRSVAGDKGRFFLRNLAPGNHALRFIYDRDGDGVPELLGGITVTIRERNGERVRVDVGTVELVKPARLTGTVVVDNGTLTDVGVVALPGSTPPGVPADAVAVVDADGTFELIGLGGGDWTVTAARPGALVQSPTVQALAGGSVDVGVLHLDNPGTQRSLVQARVFGPAQDGQGDLPHAVLAMAQAPVAGAAPCMPVTVTWSGHWGVNNNVLMDCPVGGPYLVYASPDDPSYVAASVEGIIVPPGAPADVGDLYVVRALDCPDCGPLLLPDAGPGPSSSSSSVPPSSSLGESSSAPPSSTGTSGASSSASSSSAAATSLAASSGGGASASDSVGGSSGGAGSSSTSGGSSGSSDNSSGGGSSSGSIVLTVGPYYPAADRWTHFILQDGPDVYSATGAACPNDGQWHPCFHGGEMVGVVVPGVSDCLGVTASDVLGVFDWKCVTRPGQAVMVSTLKDGQGLWDLLDFGLVRFKGNTVTVSGPSGVYSSDSGGQWWSNAFSNGINNSVVAGTIYMPPFINSAAFNINHPNVALVPRNPPLAAPRGTVRVNPGANFAWVEASTTNNTNGFLNASGVSFLTVRRSQVDCLGGTGGPNGVATVNVHGLTVSDSLMRGCAAQVTVTGGSHVRIARLRALGASTSAVINLSAVQDVEVRDMTMPSGNDFLDAQSVVQLRVENIRTDARGAGLVISGGEAVVLRDITVTGPLSLGVNLDNVTDVRVHNLTVMHSQDGVYARNARGLLLQGVESFSNAGGGITLDDGTNITLSNLFAANNGGVGFALVNTTGGLVGGRAHNVFSLNNGSGMTWDVTDAMFTGTLHAAGNTVNCAATGDGTVTGVVALAGQCQDDGSMAAHFPPGGSLMDLPLVWSTTTPPQPVGTFDPLTGLGVWQAWAPDVTEAFPGSMSRGTCTAGNCALRDYRLLLGTSVVRAAATPTAGTAVHHFLTVDPTLCAWLGAAWLGGTCNANLLLDAQELAVTTDGGVPSPGDHDLLCEDGETCVRLVNGGRYQGENGGVLGPSVVGGGINVYVPAVTGATP